MKKIVLQGLRKLEIKESGIPKPAQGQCLLKVLYCAVCRTDAKMWDQGHRDLIFPRVMGHEVVAEDKDRNRFVIWPGTSCGKCRYCTSNRENLCEYMKITGFHTDGGFADYILVPAKSIVSVPENLRSHIACLTEPVGCVLNGIGKLDLKQGERIIIYGGGSVGLIAALVCRDIGAVPLVIEKREEKIKKAGSFLKAADIQCVKDTNKSEFDAVITACSDPAAFDLGIVKLAKGGRFSFFSGLLKNKNIETNLINLIHYKEAEIHGAYGLTRDNMVTALPFMEKNQIFLEHLIEAIMVPDAAVNLMPKVLSGKNFKYILDFTRDYLNKNKLEREIKPQSGNNVFNKSAGKDVKVKKSNKIIHTNFNLGENDMTKYNGKNEKKENFVSENSDDNTQGLCMSVIKSIVPITTDALGAAAQGKIDNKTKPLGALGKLEDLAIKMSLIQNTLSPVIRKKALFVFAADHGITEEGVSAFPAEVTFQMVKNFLNGGAAINVLCRHHDIDIKIVDMGVNADFEDNPDFIDKKVRKGTRNFAIEDAMTEEEVIQALSGGMEAFFSIHNIHEIDIVGLGEMGIGNTTSASSIISTITGITPAEAVGRGTGIDDKGLVHKIEVIEKALNFHNPDPKNGYEILREIGGYEIAGIAGAVLGAASKGTAVVLDGVISTAAGLVAYVINPDVLGYLISGHKSVEISQKAALSYMGLDPVIDLNMRLGEGTGAALTIDIADAACKIMSEMASFDDAGISNKDT